MTLGIAMSAPLGVTLDERTALENAVLDLLEPLSQRQGSYLEELGQYSGEVGDGDRLEDILNRLRGRAPAVLVAVPGVTTEYRSTRRLAVRATFRIELLIISNHWRSREARASGDQASVEVSQADPGINRILRDVRTLLMGRSPTVAGAERLFWVDEDVVVQNATLMAARARYDAPVRIVQSKTPQTLIAVESVRHRHNLEDSESVNPVVDAEVSADE